jgi:mono/diheme cytochrome c family protein
MSITQRITRRGVLLAVGLVVLTLAIVQLVPYRVENPPVKQEPAWSSAAVRKLAVASCFDCHSNETDTLWFEDIAPLSWWITNHVGEGRDKLNFSECKRRSGGESDDAAKTVRNGSMPPGYYTWFGLHSDAKLTPAQRRTLAAGLLSTLQGWDCGGGD